MAKPLIILGVDGLDWQFVESHRDSLPTLSSWPVLSPFRSIFPPDSIPAWRTIFTGVGPGDHGFLDSIDYLDKQPDKAATQAALGLAGHTFWDFAGSQGLQVAVVNPFLAYPSWDVEGVMISGPVFVDGSASVTGIDPAELGPLPQLGGIVTFPSERTMAPFVEETLVATKEQADFGLKVLEQTKADLFFINLLTVDRMQHFAWRFIDPEDPTYPGPNPHSEAVLRSYRQIDEIAAEYQTRGDVVIISDHGHGRRCTRMLYVDELLRRAGLVHEPATRFRRLSKPYLMERAKRLALRAAYESAQEERAFRLGRKLPNRKAIKYSSFSKDTTRSKAQLSRLFGRNQHSGIDLYEDTPEMRTRVIELMSQLVDPATGEPVAEWVKEREDVIEGERVDRYPAVLFKLRGDYGVDFGMYGGLFGPDVNHRRISGGHKPDGVIASSWEPPDVPGSVDGFHSFVVGQVELRASSSGQ
jgi:hypothetical protein